MAGENMKESMDRTMSALKDRLRQARENLGKVRESAGSLRESAAPQEKPSAEKPTPERITPEKPATDRVLRIVTPSGTVHSAVSLSRHLGRQSSKLGSMVSGTEDEFLHIGARLHDFHLRAYKISEMSEYVAKVVNDKEVEKSITELNRILGMLKTWLSGLPADERTSTRRHRAENVVERTESCLDSLTAKHRRTAALARTFSSRSDSVTVYVGEIVRSLQYHDITRQRIEHVKMKLDNLIARVDGARGQPVTNELTAEAGGTCRELAGVLMTAREEFGHAALSITENLDMVASNAFAVSEEIHASTKGESDSEKSFLSGMGNWVGALADTLDDFSGDIDAAAGGHGDICAEFPQLIEILNGIVKSMHMINGNILYRLSLIDESGKRLSGDIRNEIGMFVVHGTMASGLEDVTASLLSIAEECGAAGFPPTGTPRKASGGDCAARIRVADAQGEAIEIF